jgi:CHASE2 domain-containing sensor protein/predicted Ser/Thr protein kinase
VRWSARAGWFLGVAVLAASVGLVAASAGVLDRVERTTVDARFSVRGAEAKPPGILIVAIDQNSLAKLPRFPFPRRLYAGVIARLHADGARLIAFDIEFTRPTDAADDDALLSAVASARPVVFASTVIDQFGRTEVLGGPALERQIGARVGATAAIPDSSGVIRRIPYAVSNLPSFAVVIAGLVTGRPVDRHAFADGGMLVDYRGPAGSFNQGSFVDLLHGTIAPSAIRGRVVIVGETAPSGQDLHPSPFGVLPGAEVQANAVSTVLQGFPVRDPPGWLNPALVIILAFLTPAACFLGGARLTLAVAATAAAALAVATQLAFNAGRVVEVTYPALSLVIATVGSVGVDYALQDRERRRMRELFAAFSPEIVAQVLEQGEPVGSLKGVSLSATDVIRGYRIEGMIGRGAMGVVYKATQLNLGRTVAIKVISPSFATSPMFRQRFERESRLAARIEHVNVLPVYEAGDDDGLLFIAMRYVDGIDLGVLVDRLGPLASGRAAAIVAQVASALDAAHAHGLVHRDVKPANILLTVEEPERAYLTDFGVAKVTETDETAMTTPGHWVGTVDYIAPEQVSGQDVDGRADIYALGGVLHYALTGSVPYPIRGDFAKLMAHVNGTPPTPGTHDPRLAAFDSVLARAMAKDPADRFAKAAELSRAATEAARVAEPA